MEKLFCKKEDILRNIHALEKQNKYAEIMKLREDLDKVENTISEICAERNRSRVQELLEETHDVDGGTQAKIWSFKNKLIPKNGKQPPTAKKDECGNLVTSKEALNELYVRTYTSRLSPNPTPPELEDHKCLKSYLFDLQFSLAQSDRTSDWSINDLDVALKSMKNNKARDLYEHTYELFKYGGKDLKISLLALFNRVKRTQTYPSIFQSSSITSIWKKKGDQADLNNDRGIFNVVKIRSILDKLIYNDIYNLVDKSMSSSNIGARKNRNIRDHLFVINGILNDTITSSNKQPLDLQIYDVSKCFDKLDFTNTANDLYKSGVQNDKFVVIANSNKTCNVSIKLPWGSHTKPFKLQNIELQGTVLAPLKCSATIDMIGKEALSDMHSILYKYKNCVPIPPLSMIDDILAISNCSVNSISMNAMIEAKIRVRNLKFGSEKCSKMHIGKRHSECKILTVNNTVMKSSSREKYLGNIITSDCKIDENITERYNKGLGQTNQILCMLKELYFGKYYFEMAMLFRRSMLLNGMLFSIESLYGIKNTHIDKLESCDKILFRKLFNAHSKTAIESFYLETGAHPIRFEIVSRRLMFYWSLLNKDDSELAKKVLQAQKLSPSRNDWVHQIEDDLRMCDISLSEAEITNMKRAKFKSIVDKCIKEAIKKHLKSLKDSHSKSKSLDETLVSQQYLQSSELSLQEKQLLFKFRTYTYDCKANFRNQHQSDIKCKNCGSDDTQEHLLNCSISNDIDCLGVQHSDIFGNTKKQITITKILMKIDRLRKADTDFSSNIGSHAQPTPFAGA